MEPVEQELSWFKDVLDEKEQKWRVTRRRRR
jgi:hypothetical protein